MAVGRPGASISEQEIRKAMALSTSNRGAARVLNVSFNTYKLYSSLYRDEESGKTLFELHKNQSGKGVKKFFYNSKDTPLTDLLQHGVNITSYSIDKLKHRLIYEGLLPGCCSKCGFSEARVTDMKVPLLLNYKDNNKSNWTMENLELLCYNCYFLYVGEVFDTQQLGMIEDFGAPIIQKHEPDWELDDYYRKHFIDIGLEDEDKNNGSEFIARL